MNINIPSLIRKQRDYLLNLCDWTQLTDSPLTNEERAAWATYRQALRDFPESQNISAMTAESDAVFPAEPGA